MEVAASRLDRADAETLPDGLVKPIAKLDDADLVPVSRACSTCAQLEILDARHKYWCRFYDTALPVDQVRIACMDHVAAQGR